MSPERPAPPSYEPLPEDWATALFVVAHPDDIEYGAAAAVARWTGQGKRVVYCMVTSGEAGIDSLPPEECRVVREAEEVAAARVVGVDEVVFLRLPDGILEYGVPLRRAIAQVVRQQRPDIVMTSNFRETFGGTNLNQADHVAVGRAVWAGSSPLATHAVDVTDTFAAGVESLKEHRAYIEGLGWEGWDPEEFLDGILRAGGQGLGVTHAATFEVLPMGWG